MKNKILNLVVIFIISSCNQLDQQKKAIVSCEKSELFGDVAICLPEIDGMKECYSNPIVKSKTSNYYTDSKSGTILAIYLNNNTYKQVEKLNDLKFDDYFSVYVVDKQKDVFADHSFLNNLSDAFESNFLKEKWEQIKKRIENNFEDFTIGRPILIESYIPSKDIRSFVFLSKVQSNGDESVTLSILNLMLIKDRVIWASYYKDFEDQESINSAKSKNDYLVLMLLDENK